MPITLKNEVKLNQDFLTTVDAIRRGTIEGMRKFEAYEIENEMSGRPGLKRRSGSLARSWHIDTMGEGLKTRVTMSNNKSTFYAVVHQKGMVIKARKVPYLHFDIDGRHYIKKRVTIPKRLHIPENFAKKGVLFIHEKVTEALKTMKAGVKK